MSRVLLAGVVAWLILGSSVRADDAEDKAEAFFNKLAADRFERALALAEPNDGFAAARLAAECAPALASVGVQSVVATIERLRLAAIASGFDRLASRMTL